MIRPPVSIQLSEDAISEKMISVLLSYSEIVRQTGISLDLQDYLLLRNHTVNELSRNASALPVQKTRPAPMGVNDKTVQSEPQRERADGNNLYKQNNMEQHRQQNNIQSFPQPEQDDDELSELEILNSIKDN